MTRIRRRLARARVRLALARWLGPWAPADRSPRGVRCQELAEGARRARYYTPEGRRRLEGAMLVAHGVHFQGPADPRLDRFCRVLSGAGLAVMAPYLPSYMDLQPQPAVLADLGWGLEALRRRPEVPRHQRPGVFSISFGSLPALRLAADPQTADAIAGLVVFGGYADWGAASRYIIDGFVPGEPDLPPHNPLNRPVAFMNLLGTLDGAPADPSALQAAWREYARQTWPRHQEMRRREHHEPVARAIADTLPPAERELFLHGCCLTDGEVSARLGREALARPWPPHAFLDPRPHLAAVRCPVTLVHGAGDDVIHHRQLDALAAGLTGAAAVRPLRTGLYSHSAVSTPRGPAALLHELRTMLRILDGITATATDTWASAA